MLEKAYRDQALSKTRTFEMYKMFKDGRESVEDEPDQRQPKTSTDEQCNMPDLITSSKWSVL